MNHIEEIKIGASEEEQIYKENILDHYKNPHNKGEIKHNAAYKELNLTCGDEIIVFLNIQENKIANASFAGQGCAISQAGTSMLTDKIIGMNVKDVKKLTSEDICRLLGIPISIVRMKCALLSLKAVHSAINEYEIRNY